ncbi:energy-coupling factor ABC transporter ATP-binding protein [Bacillus chungangensis]|uniref:Energy-coupling factor transporter ATP-binding protein EcfA2 n=1 Tax=Bacillus chungangensis TaxID=587633 RepID=A0ABT9WVK1_9BACI|nr:energy-coupling factor ABC transporter ATP-binding protein [Bacillus chungangensis]MDQ0177326.1 energy-coupling factor transport system ATP-binding protein [Bacillus chungangensis]
MDIALERVTYKYQAGTPFERLALEEVDLSISSGTFIAIIGHTGSGKSTLLQHLNALLQPTEGKVIIGDRTIDAGKKEKHLRPIRQKVGIVFQFPEHQLFEETVEKDICFGPINYGVSKEEAKKRAREIIKHVGLPEDILLQSPFNLSGGQMRRVAIAGVLAMKPDVLVLDEPTAGLDPRGRKEIMDMFYQLHKEKGLTTILVTHSMEDAARYAEEIVIIDHGKVKKRGAPREIFSSPRELLSLGLNVPDVVHFQYLVEQKMRKNLHKTCLSIEELALALKDWKVRGDES